MKVVANTLSAHWDAPLSRSKDNFVDFIAGTLTVELTAKELAEAGEHEDGLLAGIVETGDLDGKLPSGIRAESWRIEGTVRVALSVDKFDSSGYENHNPWEADTLEEARA